MAILIFNILLILVAGLLPSLISAWVLRRADARVEARLSMILESMANRRIPTQAFTPDLHYIDGYGYVIGDITCRFNARSRYLRCAVNPTGPCSECSAYEPTPDDGATYADN